MPRGIFSSMKSPITSPWSAVLTSSATITLIPSASSRASSAPEISLWSVTAIAPRPDPRGGVEQRVHRRRAVGRVVGVHVQVDVDEVALGEPPAGRRGARCRAGAPRSPRTAPRTRRPRCDQSRSGRAASMRSLKSATSAGSAISRSSWAASVSASRGSNSRPSSPSRSASSYWGRRETTGTAPPASARSTSCGAGRGAGGGGHRDRRACQVLGLGAVGRAGERDPLAQAPGQRHGGRRGRVAQPDRRAPVELGREAAQRAQEQPQRTPLLLGGEDDLGRPARRPPGGGAGRRRAGSPGSRRGSSARSGRASRRSSPCAPSRRPNSSSTTLRATWVETNRSVVEWKVPTLSAREWRRAADDALGANGSCTCTKSSSAWSSRSSSVRDTSSGSDTEPPRRNGSDWPTASTEAQPGSSKMASGSVRAFCTLARPSRTSSRESEGATTTTRCPRLQSSSESRSTKRLTS